MLPAADARTRRESPALALWLVINRDLVNVAHYMIGVNRPPAVCAFANQRNIDQITHNTSVYFCSSSTSIAVSARSAVFSVGA